jgi:pilus assembly protein Flp/PilA
MALYLWLRNWYDSEEGQDLVEYALLIGLIVLIVIGAISVAGQSVQTIFQNIADTLAGVAGS